MTTALHAQRILDAWDRYNPSRFEAELEEALSACNRLSSPSELETEQMDVLESVVRQLQSLSREEDIVTGCQFQAGFLLLRHLKARAVS